MAETLPSEPAPSPDDSNAAPWERQGEKPAGALPGGAATGWHDTRKGQDRTTQIAVAVALFFGLLGLLIGLFFWIGPEPRTVVLVALPVSQYDSITWGSNPTADPDAKSVLAQFEQKGGRGSSLQDTGRMKNLLDALAHHDPNLPLVVFVSSLSIVRDNKVYLLPANADIARNETWLELAELLERFKACPAAEKALLLDIARTPPDPFHGPLHDDVASFIDRELAAFQPNFPVLCSCSPGERSLIVPELGLSAFAAFVAEGLSGEADGYPPSKSTDGKITFAELSKFVSFRVSQWAHQSPSARQRPQAYGPEASDFIVFRDRTRKPLDDDPAPAKPPPEYPPGLREAWKKRDEVKSGLGLLLAPDIVLDLEATLLRAEERYLLGLEVADPREQQSWFEAMRRLQERTGIFESVAPIQASLLDRRAGRKDASAELIGALEKWMKLRFASKDDGSKVPNSAADLEKLDSELDKLLQGDLALDAFWYLWKAKLLNGTGFTPESLARIATTLDERVKNMPPTSELLLVRKVARARLPEEAYPEAVRSLLRTEQSFSEAVEATGGRLPEGFGRVKNLLTNGHTAKLEGEKVLFKDGATAADVKAARDVLAVAADLLKQGRDGAKSVSEAHRTLAEGTAILHACLPGMIASESPSWNEWRIAAEAANALAVRLAAPEGRDFDSAAKELRDAITRWTPAAAAIRDLEQNAQLRPNTVKLAELQRHLAGASLGAEERAKLAFGYRKVSAHWYNVARREFDRSAPVMEIAAHADPADPFTRMRRRADASVELLRLAGHRDIKSIAAAAPGDSNEYSKWHPLEDRLRKAWTIELPDDAKRGDSLALERIVRAAPARIEGFDPEVGFGKLFRKEETERRKWLAERFDQCRKIREDVPGAKGFYRVLVEECEHPLPKGGR